MHTTTTAPDFLVVGQHVARNPVARAVARRRMLDAVRDFATRIYMLDDGEHVQSDLMPAAHCLAVAVRVCELQGHTDTPELRVMAGGMSAIAQCSERGWRIPADALADRLRELALAEAEKRRELQPRHPPPEPITVTDVVRDASGMKRLVRDAIAYGVWRGLLEVVQWQDTASGTPAVVRITRSPA